MDFSNKVVLITGASSGIGAGIAVTFARHGAQVVLVGRNPDNLNETKEKCEIVQPENGPPPLLITADVTTDAEKIINSTIDACGKLNILVNNAGIIMYGGIEAAKSLDQFDTVFNTNVRAVYHLTMLAVPHLLKTKGNIVNISSVAGLRSFPGVLDYCMSKAAIDQFTRCVALELAPKGVRVNAVNPGVIITDLFRRSGMSDDEFDEYLERSKETHAMGRVGTADEVADTVCFLASDQAGFITGATLPVDGGKHAMCPR